MEKAGILAAVPMRQVPTGTDCKLTGVELQKAMKEDRENGLIPCCVSYILT